MPAIGGDDGGGGIIIIDRPPPVVDADSTSTAKRGRCRVINSLSFQKKKGNCRVGIRLIGTKRGSCQINKHFVGTKKGRAGVSVNSFKGTHRGQQRVRNHFVGKKHGLAGTQHVLLTAKKGNNNIHWFFGGSDHKGRTVVAAPVPVDNTFYTWKRGRNRIANAAIEGYMVWVGENAPPDLNSDPDAFSPTLPIYVLSALPSTGGIAYSNTGDLIAYDDVGDTLYPSDHEIPFSTDLPEDKTLYIVTRKRDRYGLVSQNQQAKQIILKPIGRLLPPLELPKSFSLTPQADNTIRVRAIYQNALKDEFPATQWAIWIALNASPDTSLPTDASVPVKAQLLNAVIGPKNPGLYYVSLALYRSTDGMWSNVLTLPITLVFPPTCPVPVLGGYQLDCDCSTQEPVTLDGMGFSADDLISIGGGGLLSSHD